MKSYGQAHGEISSHIFAAISSFALFETIKTSANTAFGHANQIMDWQWKWHR
jgi:hypothetical protein